MARFPPSQTVRYGYDAIGNLVNVNGPGAVNETMVYDTRGRKTRTRGSGLSLSHLFSRSTRYWVSCNSSVRPIGHLLGDHFGTGQITCYKTGQMMKP